MRARKHVFIDGAAAPRRWYARASAVALSFALIAAGLTVGLFAAPAAADADIQLTATADTSVLAGQAARITLLAENINSDTDFFNVAFRYELPAGVVYRAGSTDPSTAGDPSIVTIQVETPGEDGGPATVLSHQVLVWGNVADLPHNDEFTLRFEVLPATESADANAVVYPVGSTFGGTAGIYANSNPRLLPKFNGGAVVSGSYDASDEKVPASTQVSALRVDKSEPSAEGELMRGVHTQQTVYTLTVTNTDVAPTDDVVIVDYLPAGLEFLGCGGEEHSTAAESAGAPSLAGTPVVGDCAAPLSVETVTDPPGVGAGVFTRVTWNLGTVAGGAPVVIRYAAAIPLRMNTADWPGETPAADGRQGSNLDNNTGDSTRQLGASVGYTNTVLGTGAYTGTVATPEDTAVNVRTTETVQSSDLSIVKSGSRGGFEAGQTVGFALAVRGSEYVSVADMTITDTIPDGLCPLVPAGTPILPAGAEMPEDCAEQPAAPVSGATVTSVTVGDDGTFVLTLVPVQAGIPAGTDTGVDLAITYTAYMRDAYDPTSDTPTASGDSFTNSVTIAGTTTSAGGVDPEPVTDDSSAGLVAGGPSISKKVLPRTPVGADCPTNSPNAPGGATTEYVATAAGIVQPNFLLGDRVCFELRVQFSDATFTKNPQITDFVPEGTRFESAVVDDGLSTVDAAEVVLESGSAAAGSPTWDIGAPRGGDRYVTKNDTLVIYLSAIVVSVSNESGVDITANLMKYRQENTGGTVMSLRDQADFGIAPAPTVALAKRVVSVDGGAPAPAAAPIVGESQAVAYELTLSNTGSESAANPWAVENLETWDALPALLDCSAATAIGAGGTCFDPDDAGYPVNTTGPPVERSVIVWTVPGPILPGASTTVDYTLTMPTVLATSIKLANNASIVAYTSPNTNGGDTDFYPVDSLDPTVRSAPASTPAANATAVVATAAATVAKTGVSPVLARNTTTQVVPGELVVYTYTAVVPPRSTVFNGVLSDTLPTGLALTGASAVSAAVDGTPIVETDGFTLDTAGRLAFPASYNNPTAVAKRVTVTVTNVRVTVGLTPGASATIARLTNTAAFTSNTVLADATTAVAATPATAVQTVVRPALTILKTVNPTTALVGGQTVTFTITPKNGTNLPTSFDTRVTDCLPDGLTFVAYTGSTTALSVPVAAGTGTGAGGNGCSTAEQLVSWNVGDLVTGAGPVLSFTAVVDQPASGLTSFRNTATVVGSSLADGVRDAATEQLFTATSAPTTSSVNAATTTKTASTPAAAPGETVDYTVRVLIPRTVNFYNAAIIDVLPANMPISTGVVTCLTVEATPVDCMPSFIDAGAGTRLAGSTSATVGWKIGDTGVSPVDRTVTITYSAQVEATPGVHFAGATKVDTAGLRWDVTDKPAALNSVSYAFDRTPDTTPAASTGTATVRVTEPLVVLAKTVSDATPGPGDVFAYSLVATNSRVTWGSAAYGVRVVDVVPVGVVVDAASLPAGATIAGASATTGGGTITWLVPEAIADAASATLVYSATLAPSASLTGSVLSNSATVPFYMSQPFAANGTTVVGREYSADTVRTADVTPAFPLVVPTKTASNDHVAYVGSPFIWSITLQNTGGADAKLVTPTDTLPANWNYLPGSAVVSVAGAPATGVEPTVTLDGAVETLVWSALPSLPAGKSITISYSATPSVAARTTPGLGSAVRHTNTVTAVTTDATNATSHGPDPSSYTNGSGADYAFIGSADLALDKSPGTALVAGRTTAAAWNLTVSNAGPDTAFGPFTVTDTPDELPAGVTLLSAQGTGWTCTIPTGEGEFGCVRSNANDTLAAGSSFPVVSVTVAVAADVPRDTRVDNSATVAGRTFDTVSANNTDDSAQITIGVEADLRIVKRASGAFAAGQRATWTIDLTNLGPSVARGPITVTDAVPSTLTDVQISGAPADWDCELADGTVACDVVTSPNGDLGVGVTKQLVVSGLIPSGFTGNLANTATVAGTTYDPVAANNGSTASTAVDSTTTLTVRKTLVTAPVVPGTQETYLFEVANTGLADARTVIVVDALPNGLRYAGSSQSIAGDWTCAETAATPSTVSCTLAGTLPAGGTASVSIDVNVPSSLPLSSDVVNTVTADAANSAPATSTVGGGVLAGESDLTITKTHEAAVVHAGDSLAFRLGVTNLGPTDSAGAVTVTDTLPAQMAYTSAAGTGWVCSASDQTVTCTLAAGLASGSSSTIDLTVAVAPGAGPATISNSASVSGSLPDLDLTNNTAVDAVDVTSLADVTVAKTGPATITPGADATYTLRITNAGPSNATSLTVGDALPAGLTLVSMTGSGWTCTASSASCTRATLAPGSSTITVVAHASAGIADGADVVNTATVTSVDERGTSTASGSTTATAAARADLVLVKTATTPAVNAGEQADFGLALSNAGPSDAAGPIVITDTLPAGMTFVSATGLWDCAASATNPSLVTCTLAGDAGIPLGGTAPDLALRVQIAPDVTGVALSNSATAASATTETTPGDNTSTADTAVGVASDLSISKTYVDSDVWAGTSLDYTLVVSNAGPSNTAGTITVVDTAPEGMTPTAASGSGWSCTVDGQTVSCELDTGIVDEGSAEPITVTVALAANTAGETLVNRAAVSNPSDPDITNNAVDVPTEIASRSDVTIEKSGADILVPGTQTSYTLVVTNAGPSDARDLVVTDDLPAGLTVVSVSGDGWTCAAADLECSIAVLAPNTPTEITVTAEVDAGIPTGSTITNTATVAWADARGPRTDSDDAEGSTASSADLALTKTVATPTANAGDQLVYSFGVVNSGPSDAAGPLTIVDTLPAGMSFVSATAPWTCEPAASAFTCQLSDGLVDGQTADPLSVTVLVDSAVPVSTLVNSATVESATPDPSTADNTGTAEVEITTVADLSVSKTYPSADVIAGTDLDYTLVASNAGPSDSPGTITVVDTVPAGMTPVAASGTGWTCAIDAQLVSCDLAAGLLDAADSAPITITVAVAAGVGNTTIVNHAEVDGPLADPAPLDNSVDRPTAISSQSELRIVKSGDDTVVPGTATEYTIAVTNLGASDALGIALADTLPAGLTAVSIAGTGWICDPATLVCVLPLLPAGSTSTVTVVADVNADVADGASLVNSATISWVDVRGPQEASDDATATAAAQADLQLAKAAAAPTATAGATATYSLTVSNAGPSDAAGPITITDLLPAGTTFASSTGEAACAADAAGTTVTCVLDGPLAAGASAPVVTVTVDLASSLSAGDITNTATVTSPTTELNPEDNAASAVVTVATLADVAIEKTLDSAVRIGDTVTFSLAVSNGGISDADAVTLTDVLPAGLVGATVDADDRWVCSVTAAADPLAAGDSVTCELVGSLAAGTAAPAVTVSVLLPAALYPAFANTATTATVTADADPANNASTVTVEVPAQTSVTVTKEHLDPLVVGSTTRYFIRVTNTGDTELPAGFSIVDALPAGLDFVSASGDGAECTAEGATVTCTFDRALAVGASTSVTIVTAVTTAAPHEIVNSVSLLSDTELLGGSVLSASDRAAVTTPASSLSFTGADAAGAIELLLLLLLAGLVLTIVALLRRRASIG